MSAERLAVDRPGSTDLPEILTGLALRDPAIARDPCTGLGSWAVGLARELHSPDRTYSIVRSTSYIHRSVLRLSSLTLRDTKTIQALAVVAVAKSQRHEAIPSRRTVGMG